MGKIIAVTNQKGGVGKTTTAINICACLAEKRKKILLIDLDPQGNASSGLGIYKEKLQKSVYDMLLGESSPWQCVRKTGIKRLDIIPSNIDLSGAEIELLSLESREYLLQKATEPLRPRYDFIIIDCPPSLSILTINALCAADSMIVPIQCEYFALEGLSQLINTVELIKNRLNDKLKIEGILFTMYDARTNLSGEVAESVRENLMLNIYDSKIPRNVRLAEAPSHGLPITKYDSRSSGAAAYRNLAKEIIKANK